MSGSWADSWIDMKGRGYRVIDNRGTASGPSALKDGFQIHVIVAGYGEGNVFAGNLADLAGAPGVGFYVQSPDIAAKNTYDCASNQVLNAGDGFGSRGICGR